MVWGEWSVTRRGHHWRRQHRWLSSTEPCHLSVTSMTVSIRLAYHFSNSSHVGVICRHNNVRTHTARIVHNFLWAVNVNALPWPECWPDISPNRTISWPTTSASYTHTSLATSPDDWHLCVGESVSVFETRGGHTCCQVHFRSTWEILRLLYMLSIKLNVWVFCIIPLWTTLMLLSDVWWSWIYLSLFLN